MRPKSNPGRARTIATLLGAVTYRRDYGYDPATHTGQFPFDQQLGLVGSCTAPLAKLLTRAAAQTGYATASTDVRAYADLTINAGQIHRLVQSLEASAAAWLQRNTDRVAPPVPCPVMYVEADGTGVPMRPADLVGCKGRQPDGTAKTREVKVGAVFTQQHWDKDTGLAWRELDSTSYVASLEPVSPSARAWARRPGAGVSGRRTARSSSATAPRGRPASPELSFPRPCTSSIITTPANMPTPWPSALIPPPRPTAPPGGAPCCWRPTTASRNSSPKPRRNSPSPRTA